MKDLQPPYIKDLVLRLSTSAAGKYQWSTGSKTNTTLITLDTTQFYYLTVTNQDNNCSKIDSIKIIVDTMPVVYIPNIFSPDGDGLNDYFEIFSSNPHFYLEEMILFNRWGQKLYEGRGNDSKWDGKFHGEYQPIGVYVLLLKYKLYNSIRLHSGGITLVR